MFYLFGLYAFLYTLGCTYLNKANDKLLIFPKNESLVGSVIIPLLSSFPDVIVSKSIESFDYDSFRLCILQVQ